MPTKNVKVLHHCMDTNTLLRLALATKDCPYCRGTGDVGDQTYWIGDEPPKIACLGCGGTGRVPLMPGLQDQAQRDALAQKDARIAELEGLVARVMQSPKDAVEIFRQHGYVFQRAPSDAIRRLPELSDGERWEHLAFYLYSALARLGECAEQALAQKETP